MGFFDWLWRPHAPKAPPVPVPSPPTMPPPAGPPWLAKAISYIGVHEIGHSNFSPQIEKWEREQGMRITPEPWCAIFVGGCLFETGHKGTGGAWALAYAK